MHASIGSELALRTHQRYTRLPHLLYIKLVAKKLAV